MTDRNETRFRQRLDNFSQALAQLERACLKGELSELERAGLVQMFEFSIELTWNALKDALAWEGLVALTPREAVRQAFEAGMIGEQDASTLLDGLEKRNLLSHTYYEEIANLADRLIREDYAPALRSVLNQLQARLP